MRITRSHRVGIVIGLAAFSLACGDSPYTPSPTGPVPSSPTGPKTLTPVPEFAFVGMADGGWHIFLSNSQGVMRLTSRGGNDDPAWSPDGERIAFTRTVDENSDIYVMDADGRNGTRLTDNPGADVRPTWSPDGKSIAFISDRGSDPSVIHSQSTSIYTMASDGTNQVRLTSAGAFDNSPAWSPDGTRIAFSSNREGSRGIWVIRVDGSEAVRLTSTGRDVHPAWSPDGTRIAFQGSVLDTLLFAQPVIFHRDAIYMMNADGSGVILLSPGFFRAEDPSWSPDGRKVTFTSSGDPNTVDCGWSECDYFIEVVGVDRSLYVRPVQPSGWKGRWRPR